MKSVLSIHICKPVIRKLCILLITGLLSSFSFSQTKKGMNTSDTAALSKYAQSLLDFTEVNKDSALYYGLKGLDLAGKLNQKYYAGIMSTNIAYNYITSGDYSNGLKYIIQATRLSEDKGLSEDIAKTAFIMPYLQKDTATNRKELLGYIKNCLGILYSFTESPEKQLKVMLEAKHLVENETNDLFLLAGITENIVSAYMLENKLDSALYYQREAIIYREKIATDIYKGVGFLTIGDIYRLKKNADSSKYYLLEGIRQIRANDENLYGIASAYVSLSNLYYDHNLPDSGIYYGKMALQQYAASGTSIPEMLGAYSALAMSYSKTKMYDSAYKYLDLSKNINDSLKNVQLKNLGKFHEMGFDERLRLKDMETEAAALQSRNRVLFLSFVIIVFLIIAFILYRNNKAKQKTNKMLGSALTDLKSAQAQLIQSEKMASLGELTAGIAHEIQNPLNFVNNFSEVSYEMIDEMNTELKKGDLEEATSIANDIKQNLEKINHHGKRADAIVKGMLEHSRKNTGQRAPTDINALCDEYIKLSYHGYRAKEKNSGTPAETIDIKKDFDPSMVKINIIPQDIGRVILNLITNALYAVDEKRKSGTRDYAPTVIIRTKKIDKKINIEVADNGNGIPQTIIDKIFQPFFTTKPTGQGTGLGLSLSYDIVKAHGGEIKVESEEGKGTTFTIQLPQL